MPILQLYGFIAVPDGPLMLFTALLLWFYKKFTEDDRWSSALLMGIMIAALAYSKAYHGALVVLFIVLWNLRLLEESEILRSLPADARTDRPAPVVAVPARLDFVPLPPGRTHPRFRNTRSLRNTC